MPKFKVAKIVRTLDLGEYAEEFAGQTFDVWVNPKRSIVNDYVEVTEQLISHKDELEQIVERSKQDGVGADLSVAVEALDKKIEAANDTVFGWFAVIWSQGEDKSQHETPESIREFAVTASDTDPALWSWVALETIAMIRDHRKGNRKN